MYNIHQWELPAAFLLFPFALVLSITPQQHQSSCPEDAQVFPAEDGIAKNHPACVVCCQRSACL